MELYEKIRIIGKGSFGKVLLVKDKLTNQVIKKLDDIIQL